MLRLVEIDGGHIRREARDGIANLRPHGFKIRRPLDDWSYGWLTGVSPEAQPWWIVRPHSDAINFDQGAIVDSISETVSWLLDRGAARARIVMVPGNEPNLPPEDHPRDRPIQLRTDYGHIVAGALASLRGRSGVIKTCTPAMVINGVFQPREWERLLDAIEADFTGVHSYWEPVPGHETHRDEAWALHYRNVAGRSVDYWRSRRPLLVLETNEVPRAGVPRWDVDHVSRLREVVQRMHFDGVVGWTLFAGVTESDHWRGYWPSPFASLVISGWSVWDPHAMDATPAPPAPPKPSPEPPKEEPMASHNPNPFGRGVYMHPDGRPGLVYSTARDRGWTIIDDERYPRDHSGAEVGYSVTECMEGKVYWSDATGIVAVPKG